MKQLQRTIIVKLFLIYIFLTFTKIGKSQAFEVCDAPDKNSCKCTTATVLCSISELDGFTFNMSTYQHPADGPTPMCPSGNCPPGQSNNTSSQNPTWVAFRALCSEFTVTLSFSGCSGFGCNRGLQAAIYSDCENLPGSAVEGGCATCYNCNQGIGCGISTGQRVMDVTGLIPGQIYYLLVDGCGGSACSVTINVDLPTGCADEIGPWPGSINGPSDVCLSDETEYIVNMPIGGTNSTWVIKDMNGNIIQNLGNGGYYPGPPPFTQPEMPIIWTTEGTYQICVDVYNACVSVDNDPPELCKTINVYDTHAGIINASTQTGCVGRIVNLQVTGNNNSAGISQYILIVNDATGQIVSNGVIQGSNGSYTNGSLGNFTAYSVNYISSQLPTPTVGQNIADIINSCYTSCCDISFVKFSFDLTSPLNDDCANANAFPSGGGSLINQSNICADGEILSDCASVSDDFVVWYSFTVPPTQENALITLTPAGTKPIVSPVMEVLETCTGASFAVECSLTMNLTCLIPGETYNLAVGSADGDEGTFSLNIAFSDNGVANDACISPATINFPGGCQYVNVNGTTWNACPEIFQGSACDLDDFPTVWYTVTLPAGGIGFEFENLIGGPIINILNDNCNAPTQFGDCITGDSEITDLTPGTYHLAVRTTDSGSNFSFGIKAIEPQPNYLCTNATALSDNVTVNGSTNCAPAFNVTYCGLNTTNSHTVFFKYIVPSSNTTNTRLRFTINANTATTGQAANDLNIGLFTNCIGAAFNAFVEMGDLCNPTTGEVVVECVAPGTVVTIAIGSQDGDEGDFSINVNEDNISIPSNDLCTAPNPINLIADCEFFTINGDTEGACPELITSSQCGLDEYPTVWYSVTLPSNAIGLGFDNLSAGLNIAIFSSDCSNLILVESCVTNPIELTTGFVPGIYLIAVRNTINGEPFSFDIKTILFLANDNPCGPGFESVTAFNGVTLTNQNNVCATYDNACAENSVDNSLWYNFTLTTGFDKLIVNVEGLIDPSIGIYDTGNPCNKVPINEVCLSSGMEEFSCLAPGNYNIMVGTSSENAGTFSITITQGNNDGPGNDFCNQATPITIGSDDLCVPLEFVASTVNACPENLPISEILSPCDFNTEETTWYIFTAPGVDGNQLTMDFRITDYTGTGTPFMNVFEFGLDCSTLNALESQCFQGVNQMFDDIGPLNPGQQYLIAISSFGDTGGDFVCETKFKGLNINEQIQNTSCGQNNGSISISVTGGTAPYTYNWAGGLSGQNPSNLAPGLYTVTISESSNPPCTVSQSFNIGSSTSITVSEVITSVTCGQSNGAISLTTSGGTEPYTYLWTGGLSGSNLTGLNAGDYTVTITDSGTQQCTYLATYTIPFLSNLSISQIVTQPSCGNNDGSISVNVVGGTSPYIYNWSGGLTGTGGSNLAAGTYTLTVTDSGSPSCTLVKTYNLISSNELSIFDTISNTTCGNANGSITLNVSGGTAPYTFLWTSGLTGAAPINVAAGTYSVTVSGSGTFGCDTKKTYTVEASPKINATATLKHPSCGQNDGSITISTGPIGYTYAWSGGLVGFNPVNVSPGTYTATITQVSTGCKDTLTVRLVPTVTYTENVVSCDQYTWNDTTYTTSGTYTYSITSSSGCDSLLILELQIYKSSSSEQSQVTCEKYFWNGTTYNTSGKYTYATTNSSGCDSIATLYLTVNPISSSTEFVTTCGSYFWNGKNYTESGNYTFATINSNGCDSIVKLYLTILERSTSSQDITTCEKYIWNNKTYTSSGIYTYATINKNGCDSVATLNLTINPLLSISATASTAQPSCGLNNGSISINTGPTGYNYSWTGGLSGHNPVNVAPGTYFVTITDQSTGCKDTLQATLNPSSALAVNIITTLSSCGHKNGSIAISPGPTGITYAWSDGLLGQNPINVGPGTYSVTVTDIASGCSATTMAVITEENNAVTAEPDSIFVKQGIITQSNILLNDVYPATSYTITLNDIPQEFIRLISFDSSGVIKIEPLKFIDEIVSSSYTLCNKCDECVEGRLYFIDDRLKELTLVTLITPNESANNKLQFSKDPIPGTEIRIYNRWGQQVYHSKDYQNDWSGDGLAGGVYYYVLTVYGATIKKTLTIMK